MKYIELHGPKSRRLNQVKFGITINDDGSCDILRRGEVVLRNSAAAPIIEGLIDRIKSLEKVEELLTLEAAKNIVLQDKINNLELSLSHYRALEANRANK